MINQRAAEKDLAHGPMFQKSESNSNVHFKSMPTPAHAHPVRPAPPGPGLPALFCGQHIAQRDLELGVGAGNRPAAASYAAHLPAGIPGCQSTGRKQPYEFTIVLTGHGGPVRPQISQPRQCSYIDVCQPWADLGCSCLAKVISS